MEEKKPNWFVRILIIILVLFLIGLIVISFIKGEPPFAISPSMITLIAFIIILVVSESFDNLSVGKIISLSRTVKKVTDEKYRLESENIELRNSLIQVATNIQSQINTTIQAQGTDLMQLLGVVKAANDEKESESEEEQIKQDEEQKTTPTRIHPYRIMRFVEKEALSKYTKQLQIPETELTREIRFTEAFKGIDPIMERTVIFDGYIKTPLKERFLEVKLHDQLSPSSWNRLYVMLSKILIYRQVKKVSADLTLLLVKLPEEYKRKTHVMYSTERFMECFQPAIANKLLKIETIEINEEEYKSIQDERIN